MRQGIDMRNGLPMKDHANKLSGAPADTPPFRGVGVPPFAAVDHIPLYLVRDVRGNFGRDGAGTAHRYTVLNQCCGLFALLWGNQIQAAVLIIFTPASPITQRRDPLDDLLFGRNDGSHASGLLCTLSTRCGKCAIVLSQQSSCPNDGAG